MKRSPGVLLTLPLLALLAGPACGSDDSYLHAQQKIPPFGSSLSYDRSVCEGTAPPRGTLSIAHYCNSVVTRSIQQLHDYDAAFRLYFSRCNASVPIERRTCSVLYFPLPDAIATTDPKLCLSSSSPPLSCAVAATQFTYRNALRNVPQQYVQPLIAEATAACLNGSGTALETWQRAKTGITAPSLSEARVMACNAVGAIAAAQGDTVRARTMFETSCNIRPDSFSHNCDFAARFGSNVNAAALYDKERQREVQRIVRENPPPPAPSPLPSPQNCPIGGAEMVNLCFMNFSYGPHCAGTYKDPADYGRCGDFYNAKLGECLAKAMASGC